MVDHHRVVKEVPAVRADLEVKADLEALADNKVEEDKVVLAATWASLLTIS